MCFIFNHTGILQGNPWPVPLCWDHIWLWDCFMSGITIFSFLVNYKCYCKLSIVFCRFVYLGTFFGQSIEDYCVVVNWCRGCQPGLAQPDTERGSTWNIEFNWAMFHVSIVDVADWSCDVRWSVIFWPGVPWRRLIGTSLWSVVSEAKTHGRSSVRPWKMTLRLQTNIKMHHELPTVVQATV